MKKIVSGILIIFLLGTVALTESIDWSSMTDEEINAIIEAGQNELKARKGSESSDEIVIMDYNGFTATASNFRVEESLMYTDGAIAFDVVLDNSSDTNYGMSGTEISINGWTVDALAYVDVNAGKKTKEVFKLDMAGANIKSLDEVEEIEFVFNVWDEDFNFAETDPVVVNF